MTIPLWILIPMCFLAAFGMLVYAAGIILFASAIIDDRRARRLRDAGCPFCNGRYLNPGTCDCTTACGIGYCAALIRQEMRRNG